MNGFVLRPILRSCIRIDCAYIWIILSLLGPVKLIFSEDIHFFNTLVCVFPVRERCSVFYKELLGDWIRDFGFLNTNLTFDFAWPVCFCQSGSLISIPYFLCVQRNPFEKILCHGRNASETISCMHLRPNHALCICMKLHIFSGAKSSFPSFTASEPNYRGKEKQKNTVVSSISSQNRKGEPISPRPLEAFVAVAIVTLNLFRRK